MHRKARKHSPILTKTTKRQEKHHQFQPFKLQRQRVLQYIQRTRNMINDAKNLTKKTEHNKRTRIHQKTQTISKSQQLRISDTGYIVHRSRYNDITNAINKSTAVENSSRHRHWVYPSLNRWKSLSRSRNRTETTQTME